MISFELVSTTQTRNDRYLNFLCLRQEQNFKAKFKHRVCTLASLTSVVSSLPFFT